MKIFKNLILFAAALIPFNIINAQTFLYSATFSDGSTIPYNIEEVNPLQMHRLNISLMRSYSDVNFITNISYIDPKHGIMEGSFGNGSYCLESLFFFWSQEKPKDYYATLKNASGGFNTIVRYKVKIPIVKRKHIGLHVGYGLKNYLNRNAFLSENFKAFEFPLGLGYYRATHLKISLPGRKSNKSSLRGTSQFGIYTDAIFYPIRKAYNEVTGTYDTDTARDLSEPFGFRAYLKGKASVWGTREWGILYSLGAGYSALRSFYPISALGIYAGF